ncbi:phospholipid scramblase-related protein [Lentzea sp. BCCO 10_0798]|uniref:Phospholipid scramblase-related protein n=1 Tax=Lentzea kristufekii TaxID=3095430 RepID=A0ABU4TPA4_9PSEU|nr:phospholipid scramblase-related protein [Lentzea sp. BCCO 10_0798]MDX8050106.1 phospholipid scramblase-related protein [Lentzea sp. BCCO 10_0798]
MNTAPGWYPDNADPRFVRWWDGVQWTPHVQPRQEQSDARHTEVEMGGTGQERVARQVQRAGVQGAVPGGGGTLLTEPVLVVNQKAKLIEMSNSYVIYDQHARHIGTVEQVGQSGAAKALRAFTKMDSMLDVRLEIRDQQGLPLLRITRPATMWKSKVLVERGDGMPIGEIVQENVFGKVRFAYVCNGMKVGGIYAENWRAWNFSLQDRAGTEVARITKTWQGMAKAMFSTADNYVVQLHQQVPDPLRSMIVASGVTVDTVLSQNQG